MKSDSLSKKETEKLLQLLDVRLSHERRAWQRAKAQIRVIRALSLVFLFVLIAGAFFAFYMIRARAEEQRLNRAPQTTASDP